MGAAIDMQHFAGDEAGAFEIEHRLDDLTEPIVRILRESGERTITIAPETGSDRLRRVINKTVTNDEILDRAELIFSSGIENLKLYYMIGLPTETDDDLVAIRDLTLQLRERMMKYARGRGSVGRIIGSVNPLVPKPGTTYQWLPMEEPSMVERKIKRLRSLMSDIDNVYFNIKSERHSYFQALLSLGDRRVAPTIVAAERNGGNWRAAVAEVTLSPLAAGSWSSPLMAANWISMSSPSPPSMTSVPPPPRSTSSPGPPSSTSLPSPPIRTSSP